MSSRALQGVALVEYDERDIDENHPHDGSGLATRSCTDLFCLAGFLVFVAGLVAVHTYAMRHGDLRRLTHDYNFRGQLCGVDEAVQDKPLVYWCSAGNQSTSGIPGSLDLSFPTCVVQCPTDTSSTMACLGVEQVHVETTGQGEFVTTRTIITQSVVRQMSYPTMELGGRYCVPHLGQLSLPGGDALSKSVMAADGPLGGPFQRVAIAMSGLRRSLPLVASSMALAVILGYIFILLLRCVAKPMAEASLAASALALLFCGAFLLGGPLLQGAYLESWEMSNLLYHEFDRDVAGAYSRMLGMIFLASGFGLLCALLCLREALRKALGCVKAACECIFSMPSMLVQPLLGTATLLLVAGVLFHGLLHILSTVEMVSEFITVNGEQVGGLRRHRSFPDISKAMLAYYLVALAWLLELSWSMSRFVVAYSVVLWYYTEKPKFYGPQMPLIRGFIVGAVFHMGTLALGALLIALCRPSHWVLGTIVQQARLGDNMVCESIAHCCSAIFTWYQEHIEFISKNAYVDVCISSSGFVTAAKTTFGFISSEGGKVMALTGSCFIYCAAGVISIAILCGGFTYVLLVLNTDWISETSPDHVGNPLFVVFIAALLGGIVATCFLSVVDHTADTLLYAYVWNKAHGHNTVQKYAPETLAQLTDYMPITRISRIGLDQKQESSALMHSY